MFGTKTAMNTLTIHMQYAYLVTNIVISALAQHLMNVKCVLMDTCLFSHPHVSHLFHLTPITFMTISSVHVTHHVTHVMDLLTTNASHALTHSCALTHTLTHRRVSHASWPNLATNSTTTSASTSAVTA